MAKAAIIAGAVIRDSNGQYLMVQERKALAHGLWCFPGGHVDEGETLQQAAIRETQEEVGFDVEIIDPKPILVSHIAKVSHEYHAFLATITSGKLKVDYDDLLDAKWLSLDEVKALEADNKMRDPLVYKAILKAEAHENSRH